MADPEPATETPPQERSGAARPGRPGWLGFAALAAVAVAAWPIGRFALTVDVVFGDWGWFWYASHLSRYLADLPSLDVFRPATHAVYFALYRLFGADPLPFALAGLSVNVAGLWLLARVAVACGLPSGTALAGAAIAFVGAPNVNLLAFIDLSPAAFARFWGASFLLLWLGGSRPVAWLPPLLLSVASHEQGFAFPALAFVCLWWRAPLPPWRALVARPEVVRLVVVSLLLVAGRTVLYLRLFADTGAGGSHRLSPAVVPEGLGYLASEGRRVVEPLGYVGVLLLLLPAVWLARRKAPSSAAWRALPRHLAASAAFVLVAYLPYLAASSYRAIYFLACASFGFGVAIASVLGAVHEAAPGVPSRLLALLPVVLATSAYSSPALWPRPDIHRRIESVVRAAPEPPDGWTRVILVLGPGIASEWGLPAFLHTMVNRFERNEMLEVEFPARRFVNAVVDDARAPWLCPRPGDVALRVAARPVPTVDPFDHELLPIPPCDAAVEPPALAASRAAGLDEPHTAALAAFWRAYRREAVDRQGEALEALEALPVPADRRLAIDWAHAIEAARSVSTPREPDEGVRSRLWLFTGGGPGRGADAGRVNGG